MKDRLKRKLKAKKILGDNGKKFSAPDKPKPKKVYEMPPEYKENLRLLAEMIDDRDATARLLPTLPPAARAEALTHFRAFSDSVEELEQKMADEYEDYQRRRADIDEAEQNKEKAAARIWEMMERIFIVAKHKFDEEMFAEYEAKTISGMSPEVREEFYDRVAIRESYDLEHILADPNGGINRPMKHPHVQMKEAKFEVSRVAFETDEFFKEMEAQYEDVMKIRDEAEKDLWLWMPDKRPERRRQIENLDRMADEIKLQMLEYLEHCFAEDGKVEVENPDQEKLDAAFELMEISGDRTYIMIKHGTPHLLEGFEKIRFKDMTEAEITADRERTARREAEELDEILKSCGINNSNLSD